MKSEFRGVITVCFYVMSKSEVKEVNKTKNKLENMITLPSDFFILMHRKLKGLSQAR